ncbi:MAG: hypothetical protein JSW61_06215 [Candidatus Thorarchaeota archaeon]|nr:MAG: hypothetical protein JSW61_06215 [Candidatus Thorarchaeota archaeon]
MAIYNRSIGICYLLAVAFGVFGYFVPSVLPSIDVYIMLVLVPGFICLLLMSKSSTLIESSLSSGFRHAHRSVDTSILRRFIIDPVSDEEAVVTGQSTTTFRQACLHDWPFSRIRARSEWIIKDNKGNDITHAELSTYDGTATIEGHYLSTQTQSYYEEDNSEDYYSTHDDAVKYYD